MVFDSLAYSASLQALAKYHGVSFEPDPGGSKVFKIPETKACHVHTSLHPSHCQVLLAVYLLRTKDDIRTVITPRLRS